MLQRGSARLCMMIHWAPLHLEVFYFSMAPLPLWYPRVGALIVFTVEAHLLSVQFETLMGHPNA